VRLGDPDGFEASARNEPSADSAAAAPAAEAGFREVASLAELQRDGRRGVQLDGLELALMVVGSEVRCFDGLCPHEGGPMAEGQVVDGVVTCPWHGWAFHCDGGRAVDGNGCALKTYPVTLENGRVLVAVGGSRAVANGAAAVNSEGAVAAATDDGAVTLRVLEVVEEAADVKTIKLDNSRGLLPRHHPGQHVKVCVHGPAGPTWRSFTLSSAPTRPHVLDVTVKRNPAGIVSALLHTLGAGDDLKIKGPHGKFVFDPAQHKEPLVLAAAGSGITPAMSMLRTIHDLQIDLPVTLLYAMDAGRALA
jgi:nitrite reductase/ring-hydroxylating ferredoxin subunit